MITFKFFLQYGRAKPGPLTRQKTITKILYRFFPVFQNLVLQHLGAVKIIYKMSFLRIFQ